MTTAFDGIRVVDLSDRLSAAYTASLFGGFGAEVILVETEIGHTLRKEEPFLKQISGPEQSLIHGYVNRNKRSVRAEETDLSALIESADLVITSSINLPKELSSLASAAVHLSLTPHGLTGPLASFPGNNLTACAR